MCAALQLDPPPVGSVRTGELVVVGEQGALQPGGRESAHLRERVAREEHAGWRSQEKGSSGWPWSRAGWSGETSFPAKKKSGGDGAEAEEA